MAKQQTPLRRAYRPVAAGMALLMALAMSLIAARPANAVTTPLAVTWGAPKNITNNGIKSNFPAVAVDSNDHVHIAYLDFANQRIMYTNNVSGSYSPPQEVASGAGSSADPDLVIGPDNVLHLGYADGSTVYYRRGTLSGASVSWSSRQPIGGAGKSFNARLALDKTTGTLHFTWIDNRCGAYNVRYRARLANGSLGPDIQVRDNGCVYQTHAQLTVTSNSKVHIVFEDDKSGKEIYYGRLEGGGFVTQNLSHTSANSYGPGITTDGTALYVIWEEGVNNHDIYFIRSVDGGQNWSSIIHFSDTSSFAAYPALAYSASSRRVLAAWSDDTDATATDIWYREFNPDTGLTTEPLRLTNLPNLSDIPTIAAGSGKAAIAWQDKSVGNVSQVFDLEGTIVGTGCTGTLTLNNKPKTRNPITGGITLANPTNCPPSSLKMQVSLDAHVTDATPQVNYNASIPPQTAPTTAGCSSHTVYVRLLKDGTPGAEFSDTIEVDSTVDASVRAVNPNLEGLPTIYTQNGISGAAFPPPTEKGGDPRYTRDPKVFLGITDNGDCAGLKNFSVPGSTPTTNIPAGGWGAPVPLPGAGGGSPGSKLFNVVISDTLGNVGIFPSPSTTYSLTYDPPSTSPTVTNTDGLPVLHSGTLAGDNSTAARKSIIRTLSFSGVDVTDNLYGPNEGLPSHAQFWGVWVANSRTPVPTSQLNTLHWFSVAVPSPKAAFSIQWSLFTGLNQGLDPNQAGTYYVYVVFLDGAGNPSDPAASGSLADTLTLDPGYTFPTVDLPLIQK